VKAFFHCGFHKTGTSSFQELLRRNAGRGPDHAVFLTIKDPAVKNLHFALRVFYYFPVAPSWLLVRRAVINLKDMLHASGAATALVSFENFSGRLPRQRGASLYPNGHRMLALLAEVFRGDEVEFLFTTREPEAWVRSLHAHRSRTRRHVMPLERFIQLEKFRNLNWEREIADMTRGLGIPVHVTSLEESSRLPLGPSSDFLALVDPAPNAFAAWEPASPKNVG
jgi:hypothetical protein